jgi:hypothetical protein
MKHLEIRIVIVSVALLCAAAPAPAQTSQPAEPLEILKGRPDAQADELLGGLYESRAAGISFRMPAGAKQIKKPIAGDEIAEFTVEAKNWRLTVVRATVTQPLPLSSDKPNHKGLLEQTVERLKMNNSNAEVARQDVIDIGESQVGMIAARVGVGTSRVLCQEAIFQANDQLYYTLSLVSPAIRADETGKTSDEDPAERAAVETFRHVVDTVKLLDRSMVKEDQNQRLFRTRSLLVSALSESRMKAVLVPDRWLRLIKNGKDIGYTHVIEDVKKPDGAAGIYVGIRSYTTPDGGVEANAVSRLFVSFDRKHEDWTSVLQVTDAKTQKKSVINEMGASDRKIERVLDKELEPGEVVANGAEDKKQPPVRQVEIYTLNVTTKSRDLNVPPLAKQLPPFYLPQAVGHLLPRLLPLNEPKTYLFATYVSDRREVMMRYVDVGYEQDVDLGGKRVRAVPVQDRLGLEGDPTVHYLGPDGKYIGSLNKGAEILILPADAADIKARWPNADIEQMPPLEAVR